MLFSILCASKIQSKNKKEFKKVKNPDTLQQTYYYFQFKRKTNADQMALEIAKWGFVCTWDSWESILTCMTQLPGNQKATMEQSLELLLPVSEKLSGILVGYFSVPLQ